MDTGSFYCMMLVSIKLENTVGVHNSFSAAKLYETHIM
jgi:hypothetical protein